MSLGELAMTIDGSPVRGTAVFPVEDPATGQVAASAPDATAGELDAAFTSAARALPAWAADADGRQACLRAAADAVAGAADELAGLVTCEQGKPLAEARAEVLGTVAALRHFAGVRLEPTVLQDSPGPRVVVRRRPVGVIAAITPWKPPLMVAGGMKVAPALAAGNTVVLKPSPLTPLATLRLGQLLRPGAAAGGGQRSDRGRRSGQVDDAAPGAAADHFHRLAAHRPARRRGGGARPQACRARAGRQRPGRRPGRCPRRRCRGGPVLGAFGNAGQTCVAIKRVYVPEAMHDELVAALAAIADAVTVGDGRDPGTQMGSLTVESQRAIIAGLVTNAVRRGARVAAGGGPLDRPGYFYRPTILDSVTDGFRIVDEEQFGPRSPWSPTATWTRCSPG